jgi:hypothetical protein
MKGFHAQPLEIKVVRFCTDASAGLPFAFMGSQDAKAALAAGQSALRW